MSIDDITCSSFNGVDKTETTTSQLTGFFMKRGGNADETRTKQGGSLVTFGFLLAYQRYFRLFNSIFFEWHFSTFPKPLPNKRLQKHMDLPPFLLIHEL